jgi:hypothetical protein
MKKPFLFTDEEMDGIYDFLIIAREVADTEVERNMLSKTIKNIDKQTNYLSSTMDLTIQTAAAFERIDEALMGKTKDDFENLLTMLNTLITKANRISAISAEMN